MKFWITSHAISRYIERINNGLNIDNNVLLSMLKDVSSGKDITDKIYNEVPRYILYLHEKYKTCGQRIIKSGENLFIVIKREGTQNLYEVLTCFKNSDNFLEQFKTSKLTREDIFLKIKEIKKKNKLFK